MKDKFNSGFQRFCIAACVLLMLAACKQPVSSGNKPAPEKWAVTVQYDEDCGTASANPNPAAKGEKVTITAEPKSRYKFKVWKCVSGDVVLYSINTNPATFTMPGNDVTIMAEFELRVDITLNEVTYGYEQPAKNPISVSDLGIDTKTVKNIEFGAENESPFVLDEQDLKLKINAGGVMTFLVQPKAGLKAGTYTDTVIITHGNGKTAVFYMGITVKPKPVAISGLTAENREYDGTTAVTLTGTTTMSGIIDGDDVKLNAGEAAFEDPNAGTGKTVILSGFTLSGADAGNYTLPQQSGIKADILKKLITVVITPSNRTLVPFGAKDVENNGVILRQNDIVDLIVADLIDGETVSMSVRTNTYGLSGSVNSGRTGKLTIFYDGTEVNQNTVVKIWLDADGNYQFSQDTTISISVKDGLAAGRWLPITNDNLEDFMVFVNTAKGLNRHYKLINNITLKTPPEGGTNWTAIGTNAIQFTGSFDGGGFVINDLTSRQGMFAIIGTGGVVKNTALIGGSISGNSNVGGLAGVNNGTIQNCYTTANVSGTSLVGGLVGLNQGTVQRCYTTGDVNGEDTHIGGVVGWNSGTLVYCYATGRISGSSRVGGIVGFVENDKEVRNCLALNLIVTAKENIDFVNRVMGFCNGLSMIKNNYARNFMVVKYNWNGSAGTKKTITSNKDSFDGQTITSTQYQTQSWWTSAGNWSGGAWNFTDTWQMNANNLPKLKGAGGSQEHLLQVYPVEMVTIPAGSFLMGSPANETGSSSYEPQRTITLTGFYMGKYQITQEQYSVVMNINPSYYNRENGRLPAAREIQENRPVEQISWYDAIVFCNKLSMAEGLSPAYSILGNTNPADWGSVPPVNSSAWNAVQIVSDSTGYRLPTEAQWEYACRAETLTAFNNGENYPPASLSDVAWYNTNSGGITHEVGLKDPNEWKLYDMHGNVCEWCWDWYGDYTSNNLQDPQGPTGGVGRVIRSGSYNDSDKSQRSAAREPIEPYKYSFTVGFRVVRP